MPSRPLTDTSPWLPLAAFVAAAVAIVWCHLGASSLHDSCREDGPIEGATALAFFGAALLFAWRSFEPLPDGCGRARRLLLRGGALLMVLFVGEEISWGQRLFGFATPAPLLELNEQGELNLHNMQGMQQLKYSLLVGTLALLMAASALACLFPSFARAAWRVGVPLVPLAATPWLIVALMLVRHLADHAPLVHRNDAQELGELFFAMGLLAFASHGAHAPVPLRRAVPLPPRGFAASGRVELGGAPPRSSARW